MSTQQPPTPKGSRNPKRLQKKSHAPAGENRNMLLTTPPSSPPLSSSPGVMFVEGPIVNGDLNGSRKKNGTRSTKKSKENSRPNNNAYNMNSNHRHTSSQPSITSPPQLKDSPHYAGPTFHASPAPSALPIPSFFSKSVPDSGLSAALEIESEADGEHEPEPDMTPSKPKVTSSHEPSPLDFLFKAAIDARDRNQQSPEATSKRATPNTDSKAYQRLDNSSNGIFSLELDGPERNLMPIGPSFATPYRDRMNALRPNGHHSQSTGDLNDAQRRVKTEELKNLLLNPKPQRPASASPQPSALHYNGTNNYVMHKPYNTSLQTSSGPPTPFSDGGGTQRGAEVGNGIKSHYRYASSTSDFRQSRNASSALHKELSPNARSTNMAGTTYVNSFQPSYRNFTTHDAPTPHLPGFQRPPSRPPTRPAEVDTKKMEDDLKRILKLDIGGNIHPNGVQSSFA
ncbi:hypothetical protein BGW36DRAFT_356724 [Talaromyces proteolyticus]|uniref:Proteophosphoglycan 5 n=1 Tax=Talaromyces proteolyticus TaxID=1131652 RepID=A0AAD4KZY9_9EURO|nr:uncharacterized protein BGW36DRAFT_356724 [Talaromyces proteolyticus]KAH8702617.1 hypothetical protein BGW36DRAFT_356724 [Talaromyces proteolyticus]